MFPIFGSERRNSIFFCRGSSQNLKNILLGSRERCLFRLCLRIEKSLPLLEHSVILQTSQKSRFNFLGIHCKMTCFASLERGI